MSNIISILSPYFNQLVDSICSFFGITDSKTKGGVNQQEQRIKLQNLNFKDQPKVSDDQFQIVNHVKEDQSDKTQKGLNENVNTRINEIFSQFDILENSVITDDYQEEQLDEQLEREKIQAEIASDISINNAQFGELVVEAKQHLMLGKSEQVTTVPNVVADHDGVAKSFDEGSFNESLYQQLPGANPNSIDQD